MSLPYYNIREAELLRTQSQRDIYVSYNNIHIKIWKIRIKELTLHSLIIK